MNTLKTTIINQICYTALVYKRINKKLNILGKITMFVIMQPTLGLQLMQTIFGLSQQIG